MAKGKQILIVDDDQEIRELLQEYLVRAGFDVLVAANGTDMYQHLQNEYPDLIILDIMMPGDDGFQLCQQVRRNSQIPIIMLTAASDEADRVIGLELGADDYIAKPFSPRELMARIKALLRRAGNQVPLVRLGRLEFDTTTRMASVGGQPLALTPRELAVLEALLARVGRPVAREALFEKVFDFDADARVEAIEIYVSRLRKKLEGAGVAINTLRGLGYLLAEKPAD